jgi:hypothetical protein
MSMSALLTCTTRRRTFIITLGAREQALLRIAQDCADLWSFPRRVPVMSIGIGSLLLQFHGGFPTFLLAGQYAVMGLMLHKSHSANPVYKWLNSSGLGPRYRKIGEPLLATPSRILPEFRSVGILPAIGLVLWRDVLLNSCELAANSSSPSSTQSSSLS